MSRPAMEDLIVPLGAAEAEDAGRFGGKASNQAALARAGLPVPEGFCLDAEAYRRQVAALGLEGFARGVFSSADLPSARRCALEMKLALLDRPILPEIADPLLAAWRQLTFRAGARVCVRSSALVEDRPGASFAGQFESFIGIEGEADFLTGIRSCWAALWMTRALRYMATHDIDPAATAMAVLVQPLVEARVSGGGLSRTADHRVLLNATWGLGSAIAQGEVTPDRYVLTPDGCLVETVAGRKEHGVGCAHQPAGADRSSEWAATPLCLGPDRVSELFELLRKAEAVMGTAIEIEWALDGGGFKLLQARPLHIAEARAAEEPAMRQPRLRGHPAGTGWVEGRARVVQCECELSRVGPGDVLVTRVAGPALSDVLLRVAGVVAERGGSTSHLASLARERGIPMVLGVYEATRRIPDGARIAVDGTAGAVHWV